MGLSLGTPWNSLKGLAGGWRRCISRWRKALQDGLLPIMLHSKERVRGSGEPKWQILQNQRMSGLNGTERSLSMKYFLFKRALKPSEGQGQRQGHTAAEVGAKGLRSLSSTSPSPVPLRVPQLQVDCHLHCSCDKHAGPWICRFRLNLHGLMI